MYFLPYSVLLLKGGVEGVEDQLKGMSKYHSFRYNCEKKELNVNVHSESEMVLYNIRSLKGDCSLHQDLRMLDQSYLIDKLYDYY